ncbi:MAG TPA: type II toxin-antitoxin system RelE/ParE family toxin [Gammaproteobacteria bacterium]|nr:type II toxin-antitoxin system RelE/ParE family toxin [Gammaproteobacteria bacterium]
MAQVVYSANALDSLIQAFDFLRNENPDTASESANAIRSAVETLAEHPLIGHRVQGEIRELVISYGKTGYVALYRFLPEINQVRVLAVRHQRQLDYPG